MPFVSGIRHGMRRGTSMTKPYRNSSPPEKPGLQRKETGVMPLIESSADEVASKISSSNRQLAPQEIIKKYKGCKINSLKPSVYKDMTIRIYQTINLIKQIEQFPTVPDLVKIDFEFKKKGVKKVLILDIDETLIHTKRDEDDVDEEMLIELYGEHHAKMKPDVWI